jgi:hypothetical protein
MQKWCKNENKKLLNNFYNSIKKVSVESLQSHMILTMSHWSSGLTCLLPVTRDPDSNPLGGTYVKPEFSC